MQQGVSALNSKLRQLTSYRDTFPTLSLQQKKLFPAECACLFWGRGWEIFLSDVQNIGKVILESSKVGEARSGLSKS